MADIEGGLRMRWYILDENKNPVAADVMVAGLWFESNDRRIAYTEINEDVYLSTVFLSLDHSHNYGDVPHIPILYESLWFGGEFDGYSQRYATRDEAIEGHKSMIRESYPDFHIEPEGIFSTLGRLLPKLLDN